MDSPFYLVTTRTCQAFNLSGLLFLSLLLSLFSSNIFPTPPLPCLQLIFLKHKSDGATDNIVQWFSISYRIKSDALIASFMISQHSTSNLLPPSEHVTHAEYLYCLVLVAIIQTQCLDCWVTPHLPSPLQMFSSSGGKYFLCPLSVVKETAVLMSPLL